MSSYHSTNSQLGGDVSILGGHTPLPKKRGRRPRWLQFAAQLGLILLVAIASGQTASAQTNPTAVQVFYVPVDEDDALTSMDAISTAATTPVWSYVSIAIGTDGTIIYYDQWENGFQPGLETQDIYSSANPDGTQIWGNGVCEDGFPNNRNGVWNSSATCTGPDDDRLSAGNVIVLRSAVSDLTGGSARQVIDFDGGDKIGSTEQIAVSRIYWGGGNCDDTGAGTCLAGSVEVYPTTDWKRTYQSPVGEDYSYVATGDIPQRVAYTTAVATSGTNIVIARPTGVQSGDLLLAIVTWGNDTTSGITNAPPSGWTEIAAQNITASPGNDGRQEVYYRFATASEPASYTFATGSPAARLGAIIAYRSVGGNPTAVIQSNSSSTSNTAPSIAYPANSVVLHAGAIVSGTTRSGPVNYTETLDIQSGSGPDEWSLAVAERSFTTAGTTGAVAATWAHRDVNAAAHIVIPPVTTTYTFSDLNSMFEYTSLSIQAATDGTIVQVDRDGPGPLAASTLTLNQGQSAVVDNVYQGATVTSQNFPVQVHLLTGDRDSGYEYSIYTLLPREAWGNSYWSPVSGRLPNGEGGTQVTQITVFNPNTSSINVRCDFVGTTNDSTQLIAARGVALWSVPLNSGAHCFTPSGNNTPDPTGPDFFAISTVDAEGVGSNSGDGEAYDWGFTLIPAAFLDTQALVGLGIGRDPNATGNTENGSPVWVTAACADGGSTIVYVDVDGDGTPDNVDLGGDGTADSGTANGITVNTLQSIRIFDVTDGDQTGLQVFSRASTAADAGPGCDLAVAWGEDPGPASPGFPGFDVGTTVPPLTSLGASKDYQDATGDGFVEPGEVISYTITVENVSRFGTLQTVTVSDTIPANTTYVPNSTIYNVGGADTPIVDNPGFPLEGAGFTFPDHMPPGAVWTVSFAVTVDDESVQNICEETITNEATVTARRGNLTIVREVRVDSPVDCMPTIIVEKVVEGPGTSTFNFSAFYIYPAFQLTPPENGSAIASRSVPTGTYVITETAQPGWTLTGITCTDGNSSGNVAARAATFVMEEGETVTCTFTNRRDTGALQVTKVVNWNGLPEDTGQTFEICISGPLYPTGTEAGACKEFPYTGTTLTWSELLPGSYTITETLPGPAWSVQVSGSPATVVVDQTATATVANTRNLGTVTVAKSANPYFTREYRWELEKSAAPETLDIFDGAPSQLVTYDVTATVTSEIDSAFGVSGTVTIANNTSYPTIITSISDVLSDNTPVDLACTLNDSPIALPLTQNLILASGNTIFCTYDESLGNTLPIANTNTATVTLTQGGPVVGEASFTFAEPTTRINETIEVRDVLEGREEDLIWPVTSPGGPLDTYSQPFNCAVDGLSYNADGIASYTRTNTLSSTTVGVTDTDSETISVNCYRPSVSKTAEPSHVITYTWDITKTANITDVHIFDGASQVVTYTIEVVKDSGTPGSWAVNGTIVVTNPHPSEEITDLRTSLTDQLSGNGLVDAAVNCTSETVPAEQNRSCTYSASLPAGGDWTNTATLSLYGESYTGTASFNFNPDDASEVHDTLTLTDTIVPGEWPFQDSGSARYDRTLVCADIFADEDYNSGGRASIDLPNVAVGRGDDDVVLDQDDETVTLSCYRLSVEKSADTFYDVRYTWEITKSVVPTEVIMNEGETRPLQYSVAVTRSAPISENFSLSGVITVTNPHPNQDAALDSLVDVVNDSPLPVVCPSTPITVPAGDSVTCSYAGDAPTGTQSDSELLNVATALFLGREYSGTAPADFRAATVDVTDPTITVTDTNTGTLGTTGVSTVYDYSLTATCEDTTFNGSTGRLEKVLPNTAGIEGTAQTADAEVSVACQPNSSITIIKRSVGGDGIFNFTSPELGGFALTTVGGVTQTTFSGLLAGSYGVTETVPAGWTLTSAVCSDGSSPANIQLGASETVTCTFTNTLGLARIFFEQPTATNAVNEPHVFTVTVQTSINNGATWQPVGPGQVVTGTASGVGSPALQTCTTDSNGQCALTVNSAAAGQTTLVASSVVNVLGLDIPVSTSGESGQFRNAVKTWVDLRVRIDPQQNTNPLNDPHTFTISVTQNLGDGVWVPVTDFVTATVTIAPQPTGFTLESDSCADPGTVDGECTVVINSSVAQVYTANATVTTNVAGQTITRSTGDAANSAAGGSGAATKTYVEGDVVINKTVDETYTRTFDWEIAKTATPDTLHIFDGASASTDYTVAVTKSEGVDSDFAINGTVTFSNVSTNPVILNEPVDTLADGTPISLNCAVTFPYTLLQGAPLVCTYTQSFDSALDTTNLVTVTSTSGTIFTTAAAVDFGNPTTLVNDSIQVTDTNTTTVWSASSTSIFPSYSQTFACENVADDEYQNGVAGYTFDNTAQIRYDEGNGPSVTETVNVNCYRLSVEKSADTFYDVRYTWEITKSVVPTEVVMNEGETRPLQYSVAVTRSAPISENFSLSGVITVTNPHPNQDATLDSLVDAVDGTDLPVICPSTPITVPAGDSVTCTYAGDAPTGTQSDSELLNVATALFLGREYSGTAPVDFGAATVDVDNPPITVTDTNTDTLGTTTDSAIYEYTLTATCEDTFFNEETGRLEKVLPNTAGIEETEQTADAEVSVACQPNSSIVIVKRAVGGNGAFNFTSPELGGFALTTVGGVTQTTFSGLLAGSYGVTETVPAGWTLTSAVCSDGSSPANIQLGASETVTCTFTNTLGLARIFFEEPTATNAVNAPHVFTVTVQTSINNGASWQPVADQVVTGTASGVGSPTLQTCTSDSNGQCALTINSATAGQTTLVASSVVNVLGLDIPVSTSGDTGDSRNAVKTWVDLRVRIDPQQDTNPLNDPHTFTISVTQNLGNGVWVPVTDGVTATVTIAPQPAGFTLVSDSCASPGTVNGECTVVINSSVAQVYTANATVTASVDGQTITRSTSDTANSAADGSGPATKRYVEGDVVINKTVDETYTRTFDWEIAKIATPDTLNIFDGASDSVDYTIAVTKSEGIDSDFAISGTVTFSNISSNPAILNEPVDTLADGTPISLTCGVTFPYTLLQGAPLVCTYTQPFDSALDTTNLVTVTTTSNSVFTTTAAVDFGNPTTLVNDSIQVTDTNTTTVWSASDTSIFPPYSQSFSCANVADGAYQNGVAGYTFDNTARIRYDEGYGPSVTETVNVNCYRPSVSKTAEPSHVITYTWDITKTANVTEVNLFDGDGQVVTYTIEVVKDSGTPGSWAVSGSVIVTNPHPSQGIPVLALSDELSESGLVTLNCGDATEIPPASNGVPGTLTCTYDESLDSGDEQTNTATLIWFRTYTGTAAFGFDPADAEKVHDSLTVTDTIVPGSWTFRGSGSESYDRSLVCADIFGDVDYGIDGTISTNLPNVAVGRGDDDEFLTSDDETVSLSCYRPLVSKDANTGFTRAYTWTVEKTADPVQLDLFNGESAPVTYTINVVKSPAIDTGHTVTGTISIFNPHPSQEATFEVQDVLPGGLVAAVNCGNGATVTVNPGATETCTYAANTGGVISGNNVVTATMETQSGPRSYNGVAAVTFGSPTTVVDDEVTIGDDNWAFGPDVITDTTFFTQYQVDYVCGEVNYGDGTSRSFQNINTVTVDKSEPISDTATVDYTCYLPTVDKDIFGAFGVTYDWELVKTANPTSLDLFEGGSQVVTYTIDVTKTLVSEENFVVTGTITISNPNPVKDLVLVSVLDELDTGSGIVTLDNTCAGGVTVNAGATQTCFYSASVDGIDATSVVTNTATILTESEWPYTSAPQSVDFSTLSPSTINDTVTISDSQVAQTWSLSDSDTITYTLPQGCANIDFNGGTVFSGALVNTASVQEIANRTSTATVDLSCYRLAVSKDANTTFTRQYFWDIEKTVDQNAWDLFAGDQASSTYTVTTFITGQEDSGWAVDGTITISNPAPMPATVTSVVDVLPNGQQAAVSCPNGVTVPANSTATCTYSAQPGSAISGDNVVTATLQTNAGANDYSGAAAVVFSNDPTTELNTSVTVSDNLLGGSLGVFSDGQSKSYQIGVDVCTEVGFEDGQTSRTFTIDNTATIDGTDRSDSQTVTVTCYRPVVTKTANTTFTRTFDWTVEKTVDPAQLDLFDGETATVTYTVNVVKSGPTDSAFGVNGTISIFNPHPSQAATFAVEDVLPGGLPANVDCGEGAALLTVGANSTGSCTYTASPAGKISGMNVATATMQTDSGALSYSGTANVSFGDPTTIVDDQVGISDTNPAFGSPVTTGSNFSRSYPVNYGCEDVNFGDGTTFSEQKLNTVTVDKSVDASDTATVDLNCYLPTVTKTAQGAFRQVYDWTLVKTADPAQLDLFEGESQVVTYTIEAVKSLTAQDSFAVNGGIVISNPNPARSLPLVAVVDQLNTGQVLPNDCAASVAAGQNLTCAYGDSVNGVNASSIVTNVATITTPFERSYASAPQTVNFATVTPTTVNDSVTIEDTQTVETWPLSDSETIRYALTQGCADIAFEGDSTVFNDTLVNTASVRETGSASTATVDLNCYRLAVSKNANTAFTRQYFWDIEKTVDQNAWDLFAGDQATPLYTVTPFITGQQDSAWTVNGTITISNPAPMPATVTSVVDVLPNGQQATVSCPNGGTVPANSTATCTYSAQPGSAISGDNVVTATLQTSAGVNDYSGAAAVVFSSEPTTEIDKTVSVTDDLYGPLGQFSSGQSQSYNMGVACENLVFGEGETSQVITVVNTASIDETDISDSETVTVTCWKPPVIKTANTRYNRVYDYDIVKTAEPAQQTIYFTDTATFTYTLQVTQFVKEENGFGVGGAILIENPAPIDATLVSIEDILPDAVGMTVTCAPDNEAPFTVPAGGQLTCTYSAGLPDKTTRTNEARATMSNGLVLSATAPVDFSTAVVTPINDTAPISDTFWGEVQTVFTDTVFTYTEEFTCEGLAYNQETGFFSGAFTNVAQVLLEGGASDTETVTLNCYQLGLSVQKTATPAERPEPGGEFIFDVVVVNGSPVPVTLTSLTDDIYGDLTQVSGRMTGTTCALPQTLPAGGTYSCSFTANFTSQPGATETDTVTASGADSEGTPVSASDSATIAITNVPSSIVLSKTADKTVLPWPGGDVIFTLVVTNTSAVDVVTINTLIDSIYGDVTQVGSKVLQTNCTVPQVLQPGAHYACIFRVNLTLAAGATANLVETNVATASGIDDDGQPLQASDDETVTVPAAQRAAIGNRVFIDINPNGENSAERAAGNQQQDYAEGQPLEQNVAGIDILLFTADGQFVGRTQTGENGEYLFSDVAPGDYYVVFVNDGVFLGAWTGYNAQIADDINSDVDPSLPLDDAVVALIEQLIGEGASLDAARTPTFSVAPGQVYLDLDAGLVDLSGANSVDLNGIIWLDANRDGIRQPGETVRIPGVIVELYKVQDEQRSDVTKIDQMPTDSAGFFEFLGLDAGTYFVKMLIPNIYQITEQNVGDDRTIDSDINPTSGESDPVTVVSVTVSIDAGVFQTPTALDPIEEPAILLNRIFLPTVQR